MSKKTKPYPKDIYVVREEAGTDNEWLNPQTKAETFAEIGAVKRVAWYQLREVLIVRGVPEVQGTGRK